MRDVPLTLFDKHGAEVRVRKTGHAFFDEDGNFQGGIEILLPDRGPVLPVFQEPQQSVFHGLVSRDPAMLRVFQTIKNVAETSANVLVRGESGTGKELVARAVHLESHRRDGPFTAVNCAALTPTLLESELFGHVKGAFTGAVRDRIGVFEQANGGTLFLDEIAELPLDVQAKLLRVIQERVVVPVGGTESRHIDVRLVAATHKSLRQEVREGRFREDLMFRLRVVPLFIPTLRERKTDIELLTRHFIKQFNELGPRHVATIAPEAMRALLDYSWPGNVRELRNVLEYAFAVGRSRELTMDEFPPELREKQIERSHAKARLKPVDERAAIVEALEAANGHLGRAAQILGISRPTLWRKRKKHGI